MTADTLAEYIAASPKFACGCTENHVGLCPVALVLREAVGVAWIEYRNGRMLSAEYYAVGGEFLAHFEDGTPEPEPAQLGLGL